MKKETLPKLTSIAFGVLVLCFLIGFYAFAWVGPGESPPGGNVPPPVLLAPSAIQVDASSTPSIWINKTAIANLLELQAGGTTVFVVGYDTKVGIDATPNEQLTVGGVLSLKETAAPTASAGYGKIYTTLGNDLVFMDETGATSSLVAGGGATQLSDLTDVGTVNYTAGYVLRADGTDYDAAQLKGSDLDNDLGFISNITTQPLSDLSDVSITTPADNEVLTYESASGLWKNEPATGGGIGGTGTANQVAFFTAAATLSSDSNFSWDNTQKALGLGAWYGGYRLYISGDNLSDSSIMLRRGSNSVYPSNIRFRKSRGTASSPTIISAGDQLGLISFYGYDGSTFDYTGGIFHIADAISSGNISSSFRFTTANAGTVSERMRINNAGALGFSGAKYGSSGQVLTSQGEGATPAWTDAGGGGMGIQRGDFVFRTIFESLDAYYQRGDVSLHTDTVRIDTPASVGERAGLEKGAVRSGGTLTWNKDRELKFPFYLDSVTNQETWMVMGQGRRGYETSRHVGIKVINNVLYGTVADGTTESTLNCGTINGWQDYSIKILFKAGESAEFFLDGVSQGQITTNLPTGTTEAYRLLYAYIYTDEAAMKALLFSYWDFWQSQD